MAITVASRKAKGRNLQRWIRDKLYEYLPIKDGDARSTSMGATGEDILLSPAALEYFPYAVEAKAQEAVSIWAAYNQAKGHVRKAGIEPLLVVRRSRQRPLAIVDAEYFIKLHARVHGVQDNHP